MIGLTLFKRLTLLTLSGLIAIVSLLTVSLPAKAAPTTTTGEVQGGKFYVSITYPDQTVEKAYLNADNTTVTITQDPPGDQPISVNDGKIIVSNLPPGAYSIGVNFKVNRDLCDHADEDGNLEGGFGKCTIKGIKGKNDRHFSYTTSYSAIVQANQVTYIQNHSDVDTARTIGNALETNADGSPRVNCSGKGILMSFIVCPMIENVLGIMDWLVTSLIQPYLIINPLLTNDPTTGEPSQLYLIWNNIRNFANILYVLLFFVIIFSQATSVGITNYGIKHLLPRLILVVIFSNLSFFICAFLIDAFNVLGAGAASLLVNAILNGSATINLGNVDLIVALFAAPLAAPFGPILILATGPIIFGIFVFLLIAVTIILMAAIVILLRQIILMFAVMVSSVVVIAFLLPNTEKAAASGVNAFIKLLAMYPLIMILFASGKVVSSVVQRVGPIGDGVGPQAVIVVITTLSFVLPMVGIPFAFKYAGSGLHKLYTGLQNGLASARKGVGKAGKLAYKGAKMTPWGQEARLALNDYKAGRVRDAADRLSRRRASGGAVGTLLDRLGGRSTAEASRLDYRKRTTDSLASSVSVPHAVADLARMDRGESVDDYLARAESAPLRADLAAGGVRQSRAEARVAALREGHARFADQVGNDNFREAALTQALISGADVPDIEAGLARYVDQYQGDAAGLTSSFGHLNATAKGAGLQAFSGGGGFVNPAAGTAPVGTPAGTVGYGNFVYNPQAVKDYDRILASMPNFQGAESRQLTVAPGGARTGLGDAVYNQLTSADPTVRMLMLRRIAQSQGSKAMNELLEIVNASGGTNVTDLQDLIRNI